MTEQPIATQSLFAEPERPAPVPVPLLLTAKAPPPVRNPLSAADLEIILSDEFRRRFERRLAPKRSGCIEWLGSTNDSAYGKIRVSTRLITAAHCAAWVMHYRQPIPEHLELDHTCFNTLCVNVEHLDAVTHDENVRRAEERQKVRIIRGVTVRERGRRYQVRWREVADGVVKERGRNVGTLVEAQRFASALRAKKAT